MRLREELENKIEEIVNKNFDIKKIKDFAEKLSDKYMNEERSGKTLLSSKEDVFAYSLFRMPATFSAISKVFEYMNEIYDFKDEISSMVDIGSGTGSSTWASLDYFNIKDFYLLERDKNMLDLSRELFKENKDKFSNINILEKDFLNINEKELNSLNKDLCITSYMLNELNDKNKEEVINRLVSLTGKVLVVVEPGTPEGFNNIKLVKRIAVEKGLKTIAPCVFYDGECNLPKDDWCSSKVRVERSKIQKYIKSGSLGYEDEKFSYIVLVRDELYKKIKDLEKLKEKDSINCERLRILRHPMIVTGLIRLKVCNKEGKIFEDRITKKDKDLFKEIKKKKMGDFYEENK